MPMCAVSRERQSTPSFVEQRVTGRSLGIFGEPRVNVMALNLALQRVYPGR
ncbi:potassium-transporting ATPase subunit C [Paraburkholderia sp. RL17-373-BIF-A]|uniref:potassium-transporting ATPase subunit C n=1 Tax=Paraburkholderia sp. RL17-373-BIF-A TaxID=3031629 RepID=UPI0038BC0906